MPSRSGSSPISAISLRTASGNRIGASRGSKFLKIFQLVCFHRRPLPFLFLLPACSGTYSKEFRLVSSSRTRSSCKPRASPACSRWIAQQPIDFQAKIFRGGNLGAKILHIQIQVLVVELIEHAPGNDSIQRPRSKIIPVAGLIEP